MLWQDIVITIATIVFSAALLPQVVHGFKEKRGAIKLATSAPTFVGLFVVSGTYFTLSLYFSAVVCFITGVLWFILFVQRLIYKI